MLCRGKKELRDVNLELWESSNFLNVSLYLPIPSFYLSKDRLQRVWLTADLTNHNAKSAILSDSYVRKLIIDDFFTY